MAKKEGGFHWMKFFTVINFLGLVIFALVLFHVIKAVKKIGIDDVSKSAPQNTITSANYKCDGGKTISAVYFNGKVELTLSDKRNLLLIQGISASGVRYTNSDESTTFWNKGNSAFLEEGAANAVTYANCNQTSQ